MIELPDGPPAEMPAREAARRRFALDGANAQALEGALSGVERLLRDLLAAIHGDGGQHEQRHGLEESCRQAHARIADLRRELDATEEDLEDADAAYQEWFAVAQKLLDSIDELRRERDTAEERGAKWAIDERGLHNKRDTRPMARELCERMRRSR